MNYTYTLNGVAVNPTGEWEIENKRNEGQIFFRRILHGELTFKGIDYDYLNSITDNLVSFPGGCTYIDFVIYCDDVELWTGRFFYPYSFHIDEDSCCMTGTPEVYDEYTCIMDYYEIEYLMPIRPAPIDVELRTCFGILLKDFGFVSSLKEYLDYLINNIIAIDCDLTLKSSFMWRDEFPGYAAGHYWSIFGAHNYVTNLDNRLEHIYLYPNTSLRFNLGGTLCDDRSRFSFKQFEELLRNAFNAYWYIDENGNFRIEHISYFLSSFPYSDFGPQIDLTTLMSGCHSFAERKNKYEYQEDKLFDQEVWEWQHYEGTEGATHGVDFEGEPIYYGIGKDRKADCVYGEFKEKIFSISNFFTDIYWAYQLEALGEADTIGCPGWCMWDVNVITNYIRCETGILSGVNTINGHLSTANLQDHYFRWDRIFLHGNMNGVDETFDSAIKIKLQDEIEYPNCCDEFDPMKTVTTEMGEGTVHAAVQTPYSVKIQLLYD